MNETIFYGESNAYKYVLNKVKRKFATLNLKQLHYIKEQLKLRHDIAELRTLKASINSRLERFKNYTPIGIFVTVLFTSFFTALASLAMTYINFSTNAFILYAKGDFDKSTNIDMKKAFEEVLSKDKSGESFLSRIFTENMTTYFQMWGLFLFILVIGIVIYYYRMNKACKINFIIEQALEEKIEEGNIKQSTKKDETEENEIFIEHHVLTS